jgi:translation initiation factor 2 subunit 1
LILTSSPQPISCGRVGYIDLSKRRVSAEDVEKCEEKYEKGKLVHSVLTNVAGKMEMDVEELYSQVAWPLGKKFGHAYDAFKLSITSVDRFLSPPLRTAI